MPYVQGFLIEGPVDPGYGRPGGERPAHPIAPGGGSPVDPGYGVPLPPPGVWPPPVPAHPIVPAPPGTPPGTIWPAPPVDPGYGRPPPLDPNVPVDPGYGVGTEHPEHPIALPSGSFWVIVWIPGYGWSYVCVDPSLRPSQPLPPHAEPKA